MLTISSGHSVAYLTGSVAAGRENYYTGAVAAGEPPGRWSGRGAEALGLRGEVDEQDMAALYERFIDPRDEHFGDPEHWDEAATLGHTGRRYLTEDDIYAAALAAEPGADAERRTELRLEAGKRARKNVAFLDATFSVQKSITVLHTAFEAQEVQARGAADAAAGALASAVQSGAVRAGDSGAVHRYTTEQQTALAEAEAWAQHRQAVEDAIWAGNAAALEYLADKAGYSRVGHHGGAAGRWIDAHDWTVASFFQHDSRDHDPQLHIHNAILNRVEGSDGKWRTIDAKAIYRYRGAAAAVGERVMEEHLSRALGVEFATRPDGNAREVVGIDQAVMDLFSSRRRAITTKTASLVAAFEAKFDRAPNSLELDRLQRTATFATRKAKAHDGETVEARLERWDAQLRAEVRGGLGQVATTVLDRAGQRPAPEPWSATAVVETALADVQATKAAWTAADLTRAISGALPDHLGELSPEQVTRLLDSLTEEAVKLAVPLEAARPGEAALPDDLRLADGSSVYESRGAKLYATPAHIHTERMLAAASVGRGAPAVSSRAAARFVTELAASGIELGADQAAAVRGVLSSGARVETLVGPAGTGKSFVMGALAKAWQDPAMWGGEQRRVIGLAASQIATDVLASEGLTAKNIAQWLGMQQRLTDGTPTPEEQAWALRPGDLVVVDESAMANTTDLARIHQHCSAAGAKLLLTGDHRQLAAVGAGGAMEMIAATGVRHELAETRRFHHEWEGAASLRLRDGDQTVLEEYHKHGRLIDGGAIEQTEAAAAQAWLADTLAGKQSLLIVDTNEQAARLSAQLRARLVELGRVSDRQAVPLWLQGTFASVGDLVQARRNGWDLAGRYGNKRGPINREQYRVMATRPDGSMVVSPVGEKIGDPITLPAEYVRQHVALGYASTVHSAQGVTVDASHVVASSTTSAQALYVGMTRGRHSNTAHVVTRAVPADAPTGATLEAVQRVPQAVLANAFETSSTAISALAEATESATEAAAVRTPAELLMDAAELATAGRTARWLDQLVDQGKLTPRQRVELAAEDGAATLTTLLRRAELAGHDPQVVLTDAVTRRSLDDARQITNVLHRRITETTTLDPVGDTYTEWVPRVDDPQWAAYLATLADTADARRAELGRQVAADAPQWAVEALGAPPQVEAEDRRAWEDKAAAVAAHRELTRHDDAEDPLGPAPKPGQGEEYASWRAAWRALGRPEADRAEAEMSTGQLRVRVRAYDREKTWAPAYAANELAGTRQTADKHRRDATLRQAEAAAATDDQARERLRTEADQAQALADALDARAAQLAEADEARAQWYAHTAETRAAAERAKYELGQRGTDQASAEELTTAEQWLAAHEAADRAEDPHREITTEHDLADIDNQRTRDQHAVSDEPAADAPQPAPTDVRAEAADEPTPVEDDSVRVPSADETAESVRRAQRALAELKQRQAIEERRADDEAREDELTRWHSSDTAEDTTADTASHEETSEPVQVNHGPVLELSRFDD